MEQVFAVIRKCGANDGTMYTGNGPQDQACPEILVGQQCLDGLSNGHLAVLAVLCFNMYSFLAAYKADNQHDECQDYPHGHCLDPCCLVVAEQLDNRLGEGYGDDTSNRCHGHAEDRQQVTFMGGTGHHRGQRAVRHVDCGIEYRCCQVIGDKNVPELQGTLGLRYSKQCNRGNAVRDVHPQNPWTGLTPFALGLADDNTHDCVTGAVKNTGNQHNQTNSCH